jgi:hypothetical protein
MLECIHRVEGWGSYSQLWAQLAQLLKEPPGSPEARDLEEAWIVRMANLLSGGDFSFMTQEFMVEWRTSPSVVQHSLLTMHHMTVVFTEFVSNWRVEVKGKKLLSSAGAAVPTMVPASEGGYVEQHSLKVFDMFDNPISADRFPPHRIGLKAYVFKKVDDSAHAEVGTTFFERLFGCCNVREEFGAGGERGTRFRNSCLGQLCGCFGCCKWMREALCCGGCAEREAGPTGSSVRYGKVLEEFRVKISRQVRGYSLSVELLDEERYKERVSASGKREGPDMPEYLGADGGIPLVFFFYGQQSRRTRHVGVVHKSVDKAVVAKNKIEKKVVDALKSDETGDFEAAEQVSGCRCLPPPSPPPPLLLLHITALELTCRVALLATGEAPA